MFGARLSKALVLHRAAGTSDASGTPTFTLDQDVRGGWRVRRCVAPLSPLGLLHRRVPFRVTDPKTAA